MVCWSSLIVRNSAFWDVGRQFWQTIFVKAEPSEPSVPTVLPVSAQFRTSFEDGKEVIELFSSDDEADMPVDLPQADMDAGMSSDTAVNDWDFSELGHDSDFGGIHSSDYVMSEAGSDESDCEDTPQELDTVWLDSDVTSKVELGDRALNRQLHIEAAEFLTALPSYWPIPRDKRAYFVDLSDEKYEIRDEDGELLSVDALIKDKDQDSWRGGTGKGDSPSTIKFSKGGPAIDCRRSRLTCAGIHACDQVDEKIYRVKRHELDPKALQELVSAQIEARLEEGNTPEKRALVFFAYCQSRKCKAKDSSGRLCDGTPTLRTKRSSHGKERFVGCSGWLPTFKTGHQSASIPDNVSEDYVIALFEGHELAGLSAADSTCSHVLPPHVGARVKTCKYPHFKNGRLANISHHNCQASRTIYVPLDPSIRMACILPDHEKPHNHQILPPTKASRELKDQYRKCIQAAGIAGNTVRTIDNAPSTRQILGTAASLASPAFQNARVRQQIVRQEKKKAYPHGLSIEGVQHIMREDQKKLPVEKRYIHSMKTTPTGATLVFTANPFLLGLIHFAVMIQVDTTFKRAIGELKEWEVVMWERRVKRAVTIARVYSNRSDTEQYKMIFDELQAVTLHVTGQRLLLKSLSRQGTLICIGVDLELAQVLGAGLSFLPTNEPEFSGIPANVTIEELVQHFIRACYVHCKRGVHGLKPELTTEEYHRIINFPYLKTQAELDEFSTWVLGLNKPKVTAWWNHKTQNKWILPAIIKCLSKISSANWDLAEPSNNLNEGQHQWTNLQTGIKLPLTEAVETARKADERVAAEVEAALSNGILKNDKNDDFNRMSRSIARANNASRKAKENREQTGKLDTLSDEIKEHQAKLKELKAAKTALKGGKSKPALASKAQSSSSGSIRASDILPRVSRAKAASKAASKKSGAASKKGKNSEEALKLMDVVLPAGDLGTETIDEVEMGLISAPSTSKSPFLNVTTATVNCPVASLSSETTLGNTSHQEVEGMAGIGVMDESSSLFTNPIGMSATASHSQLVLPPPPPFSMGIAHHIPSSTYEPSGSEWFQPLVDQPSQASSTYSPLFNFSSSTNCYPSDVPVDDPNDQPLDYLDNFLLKFGGYNGNYDIGSFDYNIGDTFSYQ